MLDFKNAIYTLLFPYIFCVYLDGKIKNNNNNKNKKKNTKINGTIKILLLSTSTFKFFKK